MYSDNQWFLETPGIRIFNDRNQKDYAYVNNNMFSGIS